MEKLKLELIQLILNAQDESVLLKIKDWIMEESDNENSTEGIEYEEDDEMTRMMRDTLSRFGGEI